jgi:hypothetical protein
MIFHRTSLLSPSLTAVLVRFAVTVLLFPLLAAASEAHWATVAGTIVKTLDDAEAKAAKGQADEAREAIEAAYFDIFEESRMEVVERQHLGMDRVTAVEDLFHQAEDATNDPKALAKPLAALRKAVKADAAKLDHDHVQPDRKVGS